MPMSMSGNKLNTSPQREVMLNVVPDIPRTHFVDHRIYTDPSIFKIETETIFTKVWKFVCHVSEVENPLDFRTTEVAGVPLIILRNEEGGLKCFLNVCSHRGVKFEQRPSGSAKAFVCPFHNWTYDTKGECINIPRSEAYDWCSLGKEDMSLREVRIEEAHGLVFINLDDKAESLVEFLGPALEELLPVLNGQELEVISYNEQVLDTNWKNWQETNHELYHEYLHVVNRRTGLIQEGYYDRRWHPHLNGHASIDPITPDYTKMPGWGARADISFEGLTPAEFRHVTLFPDIVFLCRATSLRIDVQVPISADKTLIQFRGLGVKGEPEEDRIQRVRDYNEFWGPFGRNLPEDMVASVRQAQAMSDTVGGYTLFARENDGPMDDIPVREWYVHWGHLTGLDPANPLSQSKSRL